MMRTVSLFVVILSTLGGAWLMLRGEFYLPNRFDLALATHFTGAAGINFMHHMASGAPAGKAARWQVRQFVLLSLSIALFTAAFIQADVGPNPDYRAPTRGQAH